VRQRRTSPSVSTRRRPARCTACGDANCGSPLPSSLQPRHVFLTLTRFRVAPAARLPQLHAGQQRRRSVGLSSCGSHQRCTSPPPPLFCTSHEISARRLALAELAPDVQQHDERDEEQAEHQYGGWATARREREEGELAVSSLHAKEPAGRTAQAEPRSAQDGRACEGPHIFRPGASSV